MREVFLSASVPVPGRGNYFEDADPFLIQYAVREFLMTALGRCRIVWGGHPAITPMVWAACTDLNVKYASAVVLYQSKFFEDLFPTENRHFDNVYYVDAIPGDKEASLTIMRKMMLSRPTLDAAVFIGGMEGIFREYEMFVTFHHAAKTIAIAAPGGAARQLAKRLGQIGEDNDDLDFPRLFQIGLDISADEKRSDNM